MTRVTMKEAMGKYPKDCAATGVQIAYEYPNWTDEHVSDMWEAVLQHEGRPRNWDIDDLNSATFEAAELKSQGVSYSDAVRELSQ